MIFRRSITAMLALLFSASATGEAGSAWPKLSIFLPPNISSDKVEIRYYLYGSFGANGGSISTKPDSPVIELPLSVKGAIAEGVRLFAWTPGCQIETYDIRVYNSDLQETYTCTALSAIPLHGQIADKSLLEKGPAEIRVDYFAGWACGFFGLADCMVPQISLGVVDPDAQGRFDFELPDFTQDPASSNSRLPSEFQLVLREVKTWNPVAFLEPELKTLRAGGSGLIPVSSYPQLVVFRAEKK